ncbi:MAG: hypothetical protein ABIR80_12565 [Opitutaceae bacterium]
MVSAKVLAFVESLPRRERAKVVEIFNRLAAHPILLGSDLGRTDSRGRTHHLRFVDGYAVLFWFDHAEKVVNVMETGWQ